MFVIISFTYYSLFALEVVAIELTVYTYFCEDSGLLPIDDLGFICLVVANYGYSSFDFIL